MITRKDLIATGSIVCARLRAEEAKPELQGPDNKARYAARGLAAAILDDLYYAAPIKVRESFGFRVDGLFKACGWPE